MPTPKASRRGRTPSRPAPRPRKQPRQERAAATRDAIVTAAERVLEAHGVAGLTTNRVAEVAGVSIGSVYEYFPNKEAIAAALIAAYWERFNAAMAAGLALRDRPLDEVMRVMATGLVEAYESMPRIHRHLRDLHAAAGQLAEMDRLVDFFTAATAAYLRARPELDVRDPDVTAFVIVSAVGGVINDYAIRSLPFDARRLGDELMRLLGRYLSRYPSPP